MKHLANRGQSGHMDNGIVVAIVVIVFVALAWEGFAKQSKVPPIESLPWWGIVLAVLACLVILGIGAGRDSQNRFSRPDIRKDADKDDSPAS